MEAILSLGLGYLVGSISPAAWVSRRKNVNLKEEGTGNLGATNTMIVMGRAAGIFVMVFDILKSYLSYRIARVLFPQMAAAGLLACVGAILGHCFPIFLHFDGGKGLAAFGGMVLAYSPKIFLLIVVCGLALMALLDTGVAMPMLASPMFPLLIWVNGGSLAEVLTAIAAGVIIVIMHWGNLERAIAKEDVLNVHEFLKNILFKKK